MQSLSCDYCGKPAQLVTGETVYPHRRDLWKKRFWMCKPCEAYVGCHGNSGKPLGRLANVELRKAKIDAHAAFDSLWKSERMTRKQAYARLANILGIKVKKCHIGMFDVDLCRKVIQVVSEIKAGERDGRERSS